VPNDGFGWLAGPLSLVPGDAVRIIFSGTNTSDSQLGDLDKTKIELAILDQLLTLGVAAVAGGQAGSISKGLGVIGDPVGTILGVEPEGPCNGPVFGDGIDLPGDALANLPFDQEASANFVPDGAVPEADGARATSFLKPDTGTYTDEATDDTDVCGRLAESKVRFTISRLDSVSLSPVQRRVRTLGQLREVKSTSSVRTVPPTRPGAAASSQYEFVKAMTCSALNGKPH